MNQNELKNSHGRRLTLLQNNLTLHIRHLPSRLHLILRQPQRIILHAPHIIQIEFVRWWRERIPTLGLAEYQYIQ